VVTDAESLKAIAEAVPILWDEAQEQPSLLRFLAPFGRPDLRQLERAFRSAPSLDWILSEPWPLFGTWLAAALVRLQLQLPHPVDTRSNEFICRALVRDDLVDLAGGRSLVVAGDLRAPAVIVEPGARLAVAGDLTVDTLVSSGVVLVQRSLRAHTVVITDLTEPPGNSPRFVGWQVGESLTAQVLDSPRFGLACPITCDGIVRFAGKIPDPVARERARQRLTKPVWRADERGIDEALLMERLRG
jgi:hypothetical protein